MSKPVQPLTASAIREFGRTNPQFVAQFSPEDQRAFRAGARGRMPAAVRKAAPKAMGRARYIEGTPKTVRVEFKNDKGRKVAKFVPEAEARALAGSVAGKRGPLSRKALDAAGVALAKSLKV